MPLPPTNATYDVNRLAPFSFDVRWDPPQKLSEFDRYQVALGIRNTVRYLINKDEERVVTFDEDLEPGETYEVVVKTVSGNVASWPAAVNITTSMFFFLFFYMLLILIFVSFMLTDNNVNFTLLPIKIGHQNQNSFLLYFESWG